MYDTHVYTGALYTPVHVYTDCQTVHMYTIPLYRCSEAHVARFYTESSSILCQHPPIWWTFQKPLILTSSLDFWWCEDFMPGISIPSGFLFCLRVSSLSQRPRPELAGVHWIPGHRPSLHSGPAEPSSQNNKHRHSQLLGLSWGYSHIAYIILTCDCLMAVFMADLRCYL